MSYILEALKKAEAERNGAVNRPGPLLPPLAASAKHRPAWRRPLPWAALAALAVTLACAAWFTLVEKQPPAPAPPVPQVRESAPPPVAAVEPEKPKEKPAPKKPVEKKRPPEEAKTAKAPEPAIGTLQDLPPAIQREIPALTVGGYIYSGNKGDSSVLVNNRLLHEGEEAAPGLVIEKMTRTGMILSYKGYRYRRGY